MLLQIKCLQGGLDALMGLFEWVGLKKNTGNTKSMIFTQAT